MKRWWAPTGLLVLLLLVSWGLPAMEFYLPSLFGEPGAHVYDRDPFLILLQSHLWLVAVSALVSTAVAVCAGVFVTREVGQDFLPLVSQIASIGQTIPPVAVLALAVPVVGFGEGPTIIALILYGLLPILRNTLVGLEGIESSVRDAATGMGMTTWQVLFQVELPLAARVILAGIRTSVTVNIATAAIGSTIGAKTLGDPVIAGLINGNIGYVLQGAILIGLLALTADSLFESLEKRWDRHDR